MLPSHDNLSVGLVNGPGVASVSGCFPWQHVACSGGLLYCRDCEGVLVHIVGGWAEHTFQRCDNGSYRAACRSGCFAQPGSLHAGPCIPCNNALGATHFQYMSSGITNGAGNADCAWECEAGYVKRNKTVLIGAVCARYMEECEAEGVPQMKGCNSSTWSANIAFIDGKYLLQC